MMQQVLQEAECLRKVLVQTIDVDAEALGALCHTVVAGNVIESLFDFRDGLLVGTYVVEIISSIAVAHVILVAQLITEGEVEEVVLCVLLVEQRQLLAGLGDGEVFLEVEELGLYRSHFCVLNLLNEIALILAVGRYRSDGRLLNLLERLVLADALVYTYEVVGTQMLVGKVDDIFLGQLALAVELLGYVFPFLVVDEGVYHDAGSVLVVVESFVEVELLVCHDSRKQFVGKLATAQLIHLAKHEGTCVFELLSLVGQCLNDESGVVVQTIVEGSCRGEFHLLLQVYLEESCLAIGEQVADDIEGVVLLVVGALEEPCQHHVFLLLTDNRGVLYCCDGWLCLELRA